MNRLLVAAIVLVTAAPGSVAPWAGPADGPPAAASSGDPAIVELIKTLESERLQAGIRKDVEAVAAATSDRYMQIDLDGKVLDKATTLQRIRSSFARLTANPVSDVVVRVFGDSAILTAVGAPQGTVGGKNVGSIRYTRVYVKEDGRWRVAQFHQTRIAGDQP